MRHVRCWLIEYHENRGFVRFSIVDTKQERAIGTIEMFRRESEDATGLHADRGAKAHRV